MAEAQHKFIMVVAARDDASATLAKVGKTAQQTLGSVGGQAFGFAKALGVAGLAAAGITLSLAGLFRVGTSAFTAQKQLKDLSYNFGELAETVGKWKYVADVDGMGFDKFTSAITKMNEAIGESLLSGKESVFEKIGLNVQRLAQMGTQDRLLAIADALDRIRNSAVRTKYGMDVFGKGASEIMPLLAGGSKEVGSKISGAKGLSQKEIEIGNIVAERLGELKTKTTLAKDMLVLKGAGKLGGLEEEAERRVKLSEIQQANLRGAQLLEVQEVVRKFWQDQEDKRIEGLGQFVGKWQEQMKTPKEKFAEDKRTAISAFSSGLIDSSMLGRIINASWLENKEKGISPGSASWSMHETRTGTRGGNRAETLLAEQVRLTRELVNQNRRKDQQEGYKPKVNESPLKLTYFR